ncbi:hypothetical protein LCGC14_1942970 [marine sediment metagenome]|uniref:Uncharacterized protein n=1 Tax=marine sediment metagenome TaxID=412755 RepID=A0A0F9HY21_9ZZZZ
MTANQELRLTQKDANGMIKEMRHKLGKAIEAKDWHRAADLESYIHGMEQMEILYNLKIDEIIENRMNQILGSP